MKLKAFTLIELVLVLVLIGTLGLFTFFKLNSIRDNASKSMDSVSSQRLAHSSDLEALLNEDFDNVSCQIND